MNGCRLSAKRIKPVGSIGNAGRQTITTRYMHRILNLGLLRCVVRSVPLPVLPRSQPPFPVSRWRELAVESTAKHQYQKR